MRPGISAVLFLALSTLLLSNPLFAEKTAPSGRIVPELRATRINPTAPVIDGDLSDKMWNNPRVEITNNFTQMEPDEGQPITESTLVTVVYDDDAIYFAFWNYDSEPTEIKGQLVRRDRWSMSDNVTVMLDPYHDHQSGYRFELNVSAVQRDFRIFDDVNMDSQWDGIWEGAVKMQPWGWSAEFRIPYHCLRFGEKDVHTWGFNVARYVCRKNETQWWSFSPSTEGGYVSTFGHLTDITGIEPARHMEVMPYAVSSFETEPKRKVGNPDGRDYYRNMGLDLKYGISSNLTLDATINPDFGQVELDNPVLNLSAFEIFFDEKRPFFMEGAGMFSTPFMLFYSRRIGRAPYGGVPVPDGCQRDYTDYPKAATILGAGKLTGKLSSGTAIAFLNATTDEEKAECIAYHYEVNAATGDSTLVIDDTLSGVVEPRANYSVFRIRQDVLTNSSFGILMTNTSQDRRHPAMTGGIDWRLSNATSTISFSGQTVFSRVDNLHTGFGFFWNINKRIGKHLQGAIGGTIKDPHLQINRLGYTSRNDTRRGSAWVQYRTNDDWFIFRNTYHNLNYYAGWNYDGVNIEKGWNYNAWIEFTNNWGLGYGYNQDLYEYADWETRGYGPWKRPRSWSWWASLNTDDRKMITLNLNPGSGENRNGPWWAHYTGISVRPRSNMEYAIGVNYSRGFGQTIFVSHWNDRPVFADMDQDEMSLSVSASIMLRRNLSFQLSGSGYITGLDYKNYRLYLGSDDYEILSREEYTSDFNRNFSALNSTMVVRWEYLPGSTLYLVWTRSRPETDRSVNNLDVSRDLDRFFSAGSYNIWLVKASYWWNI